MSLPPFNAEILHNPKPIYCTSTDIMEEFGKVVGMIVTYLRYPLYMLISTMTVDLLAVTASPLLYSLSTNPPAKASHMFQSDFDYHI